MVDQSHFPQIPLIDNRKSFTTPQKWGPEGGGGRHYNYSPNHEFLAGFGDMPECKSISFASLKHFNKDVNTCPFLWGRRREITWGAGGGGGSFL